MTFSIRYDKSVPFNDMSNLERKLMMDVIGVDYAELEDRIEALMDQGHQVVIGLDINPSGYDSSTVQVSHVTQGKTGNVLIVDDIYQTSNKRIFNPMYDKPEDLRMYRQLRKEGHKPEAAKEILELMGIKQNDPRASGHYDPFWAGSTETKHGMPYYHGKRRF